MKLGEINQAKIIKNIETALSQFKHLSRTYELVPGNAYRYKGVVTTTFFSLRKEPILLPLIDVKREIYVSVDSVCLVVGIGLDNSMSSFISVSYPKILLQTGQLCLAPSHPDQDYRFKKIT